MINPIGPVISSILFYLKTLGQFSGSGNVLFEVFLFLWIVKWHLKQHPPFSLELWPEMANRNCFRKQGSLLRPHSMVEGGISVAFRALQPGWLVQRMASKRSLQGEELL